MRYLALATDYDGTIAIDGQMPVEAVAGIARLRKSGRRAILVTGRRLDQLLAVCPQIDLFDYVVAENGALVYAPRTRVETLLGKPPLAEFIERLRSLGVDGVEVGRVIVSTWLPNHIAVLQAIQEVGLGSEWVRAPRRVLEGPEREAVLAVIRRGIETRPDLPGRAS